MKDIPPMRRIPWLALFLAAGAIITFFLIANEMHNGSVIYSTMTQNAIPPSQPTDAGTISSGGSAGVYNELQAQKSGSMPYYPYPQPYGDATAKDTREFLKMYYNANMKTRNVPKLTDRVETTVRGHGGRVDQISRSDTYGSVTFVVPQSKFDAFRSELEGLVGSRFLSLNINSQNMLPEKQSIEAQQKSVETSIADLTANRKKLVSDHASTANSLQSQINAHDAETASLQANATTDPAVRAQINARLQVLAAEETSLKNRLANENSSYTYQLNSIDQQLKYANTSLEAVKTQDQNLLDNVATVNGTVSIQWISLWEIAQLYLPGYWIPGILAALAALAYWWHRRQERIFLQIQK